LHHNHRGGAIERVALLMMHKKWILKKRKVKLLLFGHKAQTATTVVAVKTY
jgi:hypothetical protein